MNSIRAYMTSCKLTLDLTMKFSQAAQLRIPVLTAIGLVNGKPWEPLIFDPHRIDIR